MLQDRFPTHLLAVQLPLLQISLSLSLSLSLATNKQTNKTTKTTKQQCFVVPISFFFWVLGYTK